MLIILNVNMTIEEFKQAIYDCFYKKDDERRKAEEWANSVLEENKEELNKQSEKAFKDLVVFGKSETHIKNK